MRQNFPLVDPKSLHVQSQITGPVPLLDVRSEVEFADGHVPYARNLPLDQLSSSDVVKQFGSRVGHDETLYVTCASGLRAQKAAMKLQEQGFSRVHLLEGGMDAWKAEQLPIKRRAKLPSLERQTQIALGVLLLLILAKGSLLHPLFHGLAGLLGVGLIFAGVTARCGLSALLARMPWNRSGGPVSGSA